MNKNAARKTARHEAGHFVMRWYLGLPATQTEIFNEEEGINHGTQKVIREDACKFLLAAGYAAEFRNTPIQLNFVLNEVRRNYEELKESGCDFTELWRLWERYGVFSDDMIHNYCITAFYAALDILKYYKEKLDEITQTLLTRQEISQAEANDIFQTWGKPESVAINYAKIIKKNCR